MSKEKSIKAVSSIFIILLKSTKIIKLIQAIKLLKFAKPFVMVFTMLISILAYAAVWDWKFAVGLVLLMFFHELGHIVAMNKEGFPTNAPVFIPFLGAMLFSPKGMDRRQEAVIGIGGPILGTISALALVVVNYFHPSQFILILAYLGLFLNLFQMIPLSPLDGGRVIQAVGKNFQFVGILFLLVITFIVRQPSILLIWIIVFFDFKFLTVKQRIFAAAITLLVLIIFTSFGIGIPDDYVRIACIVDSVVGAVYVGIIIREFTKNRTELEAILNTPERPELPARQKFLWLGIYLLMAAALLCSMIFLAPLITITQTQ